MPPLKLLQELADLHGLRNEEGGVDDRLERSLSVLQLQAQQVLVVQDSADVVETLAVDRVTGIASLDDELERLFPRCFQLDRINLRARNHDLLNRSLRELEDTVDQLLLRLVEDPLLLPLLNHQLDLLLADKPCRPLGGGTEEREDHAA